MTSIKSTKRIIEYLKQQENAVTPTTIRNETKISYNSVLCSLRFLIDLGFVSYVTDGKINLVSWKDQQETQ